MSQFDNVRVGVGLCIMRDDKVLLQKRIGKHAGGTYCFPGGHMEKWESIESACVRETKEEAGLDLQFTTPKLWTTVNTMYRDEGKHYLVVLMKAEYISGEAINTEPDKCEGWGWYSWWDLPSPLIQGIQIIKDNHECPLPRFLGRDFDAYWRSYSRLVEAHKPVYSVVRTPADRSAYEIIK